MSKPNTSERINQPPRHFPKAVAVDQYGAAGGARARSNELEVVSPFLQARAASHRAVAADIELDGQDDASPNFEAWEIYRVDASVEVIRTFETINARIDLIKFARNGSAQLEFLTSCHLIILLTDGLAKGCDWSDGQQTRRLSFLAPNTVVFNPAQNYLRIRAVISQSHCRMLVLAIHPTLMKWRGDLEIDLAAVAFRQQIVLGDEQARQTLVAIQEELEAPGINGAFYVEVQLFLLVTRLIRRASELVETSSPVSVKGGLPNWRLKRAIELLEGNVSRMPTLAEVARLIGLHPTSFCRGFKHSTGLSPHRYMLAHRVKRAKEMMNDRRRSLTEIALECGFSGSSQFSVVFKKITGLSPREFRRAL